MIPCRPYQLDLKAAIYAAWQDPSVRNVVARLPTGGGKTVVMAHLNAECQGASIDIAHRQELIGQTSMALARNGIRHRIIGPTALQREVVRLHMDELGRSFFDPQAWAGVAGIDTLIRRPPTDPWFQQVTLWQTDEGHHVLRKNKWGKGCELFPNARGVLWTATPGRADGFGLGRHADGVADAMVEGPEMRWLIENHYLTDYRIFCPTTAIDLTDVNVTPGGDFNPEKLRKAVHKSQIVGDVVKHYMRIAHGKLGVTFAVDVEDAVKIAAAYNAAGVPAEVVTADTPTPLRAAILRKFKARGILQLVNVDLFGEGFDLPAIEVVSMARPTQSFTLYAQQFGRALRLLDGKSHGIIIDHVNNVVRHNGPPDRPRPWSLDRRERRSAHMINDVIPVRVCPNCTQPYERIFALCPYCKWKPEPMGRSLPEQVDGDLHELTPEALKALRGEVDRIDGDAVVPPHLRGSPAAIAIHNNFEKRRTAQVALRDAMSLWMGWHQAQGRDDSEVYRRFFFAFGMDVLTAYALGAPDADALAAKVSATLAPGGLAPGGVVRA